MHPAGARRQLEPGNAVDWLARRDWRHLRLLLRSAQDDIKKLVAYSSVAHLGYCMIGLFALNEIGMAGGVLQMINHGLSTGALFLLVGMLYERYHTRQMADYSGMAARLKLTAVFWVFITMSSVGLPGLNGFVSETLTMMGMYAFQRPEVPGWLLSGLATAGILLGAWYMLMLLRRSLLRRTAGTGSQGAWPHRRSERPRSAGVGAVGGALSVPRRLVATVP